MKKMAVLLFTTSILLQSCYSYKSIDLNKTPLVVGNKYKLEYDNKCLKANLTGLNDSIVNFKKVMN